MTAQPAEENVFKRAVKNLTLQNYTKRRIDYNPSDHRDLENGTTYFETLTNMFKASIGTGILAMPHAFLQSGYIIGAIGTILIGMLCTYSMRTIVAVQYELCRRNSKPSYTYNDTAVMAINEGPECCRNNRAVGYVANILIILFQLGCGCIYLLFVSTNLKEIIESYTENKYMLLCYLVFDVCLLSIFATISHLKTLARVSMSANITMSVSFFILAIFIYRGKISLEDRTAVGYPINLPLFIGTVLFSLEAIGCMIPLENGMKEPLKFTSCTGVLHTAMIPTVTLYLCVGLFGYLRYGDDIKGSITLNLPHNDTLAMVCKIMFLYGIFCTNVLNVYITFEIVWKSYVQRNEQELSEYSPKRLWAWKYISRLFVIYLEFLFSVLIPNLELFISLIGSMCLASSGIALPAIFNLFTYWHDYEGYSFAWFFTWCTFLIIIGILASFIGVIVTFENIYVQLWSDFFSRN